MNQEQKDLLNSINQKLREEAVVEAQINLDSNRTEGFWGFWGFIVILIGILLSMAMVGAAYLVRDERRENLTWNGGGDTND